MQTLIDHRHETEYTVTERWELLRYCRLVMQDHRTLKYPRIDFLLDAYLNWKEDQ